MDCVAGQFRKPFLHLNERVLHDDLVEFKEAANRKDALFERCQHRFFDWSSSRRAPIWQRISGGFVADQIVECGLERTHCILLSEQIKKRDSEVACRCVESEVMGLVVRQGLLRANLPTGLRTRGRTTTGPL